MRPRFQIRNRPRSGVREFHLLDRTFLRPPAADAHASVTRSQNVIAADGKDIHIPRRNSVPEAKHVGIDWRRVRIFDQIETITGRILVRIVPRATQQPVIALGTGEGIGAGGAVEQVSGCGPGHCGHGIRRICRQQERPEVRVIPHRAVRELDSHVRAGDPVVLPSFKEKKRVPTRAERDLDARQAEHAGITGDR